MTFQPIVPLSGFAGWAFLERTRDSQQTAFNASPAITRNVDYFKENIGAISSAEDLVNDRRLLEVALGAFGLEEDINSKFFVQKILEEGVIDPGSLANRLSDKRYEQFAEAFGFDLGTPNTQLSTFADDIAAQYQQKSFEVAIGNTAPDMRLALSLDAALDDIAAEETSDDGRWFLVMGQPSVRTVFETALGLPSEFGALDLDLQLKGFRDASDSRFGVKEVADFSDPEKREDLIRLFLIQSETANGIQSFTSGSVALTLLQSAAQ